MPTTWQSASEDLLASARRAETLLAVILGVAPADNTTANVPAQLARRSALNSPAASRLSQRLLADR